jgi:hypothetical protein
MTTLFQKRHYEWLADWLGLEIKQADTNAKRLQATLAARHCAIDLQGTNPQFNRSKFNEHVDDVASGTRIVRRLGDSYKVRPAGLRRAV